MTGLSREPFQELTIALFVDNNQQPIFCIDRPKLMDWTAQIGLYLIIFGSTMGIKNLCIDFGLVPSCCSDVINKILWLVVKKLK